jgi:hypothetical protein
MNATHIVSQELAVLQPANHVDKTRHKTMKMASEYLCADLDGRKPENKSLASSSASQHIKPPRAPQNNKQRYQPQSQFGNISEGNYNRSSTRLQTSQSTDCQTHNNY